MVDCLFADLVRRLEQLFRVAGRQLKALGEESDHVAVLGRTEVAVGVGDVEEDGRRGEPEGIVLVAGLLRLGVLAGQHVEDAGDAHGAGV